MRGECLDKAKETINGERQDICGNPENSFQLIAEFWNTYLTARQAGESILIISKKDVMHMMVLLKMARAMGQKYHSDNYIDAAGYIALADDEAKK